jgi:hypothetical protein
MIGVYNSVGSMPLGFGSEAVDQSARQQASERGDEGYEPETVRTDYLRE